MAWDDLRLREVSRMAGIIIRGKGESKRVGGGCHLLFSLYISITHGNHHFIITTESHTAFQDLCSMHIHCPSQSSVALSLHPYPIHIPSIQESSFKSIHRLSPLNDPISGSWHPSFLFSSISLFVAQLGYHLISPPHR